MSKPTSSNQWEAYLEGDDPPGIEAMEGHITRGDMVRWLHQQKKRVPAEHKRPHEMFAAIIAFIERAGPGEPK